MPIRLRLTFDRDNFTFSPDVNIWWHGGSAKGRAWTTNHGTLAAFRSTIPPQMGTLTGSNLAADSGPRCSRRRIETRLIEARRKRL